MTEAEIDQLTERIIGCGIEVHRTFGAGLLESVYRECMAIELRTAQLRFETERQIKLKYKGMPLANHLRLDLLVEGIIVVELKAVECLPSSSTAASRPSRGKSQTTQARRKTARSSCMCV